MNSIMIVFKKEMLDMFRDKKTLITGILIPILIFPLMYGVLGKAMFNNKESVEANTKLAVSFSEESEVLEYFRDMDDVQIIKSDNIDKTIDEGKAEVGMNIPMGIDSAIVNNEKMQLEFVYDNSDQKSLMAYAIIENKISEYSKIVVERRLKENGIDIALITPFTSKARGIDLGDGKKKADGMGAMMMSMLLPMFLILYAASGPLAAATDLGAGEKERGTLEPLLSTKVNRTSLLWGKLFAITTMGVIGVVASLIGLFIAIKNNPIMFGEGMSMGIDSLVAIGILTILLTMVFSAIEMSISVYARSFKEAQTYLAPMSIVAIIIGIGSYGIDVKSMSDSLLFIPIYNVSLCLKEIAVGRVNYTHIGITAAILLVLVVVSVMLARRMFNKENVIFRT